MDAREALRQRFNEGFARWEIELPPEAMEIGRVGSIAKSGWFIWVRFDAEDGREHLDYYAMHRMTNDRHVRLYADGDDEALPAFPDMWPSPQDPEEREASEREYQAYVKKVRDMLEAKGFVRQPGDTARMYATGDPLGINAVNHWIHTNPDEAEAIKKKRD